MSKAPRFYTAVVILIACCLLAACAAAEKSASMAFDNANSVVKDGGDKLFMDPEPTPHKEDRY